MKENTGQRLQTAPRREFFEFTPEGFRRAEWLLVLLAVSLAVCAYGLRLQDSWLVPLREWFTRAPTGAKIYIWNVLEPLLSFFISPLIFKGALAAIPLLGFIALSLGRRLLFREPAPPGGLFAWMSVALFVGWCLLSALWSPTPDIARDAAYFLAIYGGFFFLLLRRGVTPAEARQFALLLIILGFFAIAILYMQALPFFGGSGGDALIFKFMYFFKDSPRNQVGSLLGHNTSVASFLLMTFFPAAALFIASGSRRTKLILGAYLAIAVFGILLAQSRSIWILGPLLGVPAMRSMLRGKPSRRVLPTIIIGILALGLISQTINRPWNPFYIRTLSLSERVQDLKLDSLKLESRLRLNVIGVRLVPEHPFKGHGLFAFQYIYPRKQGEYFNINPDSDLNRTTKRSNMAHNEYLQTLIDHGLIGLGFMLWVLVEIARGGWRARRGSGHPHLLHEAFGWSSLGIALHALFDFPFHIAQLMLPGMVCMAAWGSWREIGAVKNPTPAAEVETGTFRPKAFARLLAALLFLALTPLAALPMVTILRGDAAFNSACGLTRTVIDRGAELDFDTQAQLLERSSALLSQAKVLTPSNYSIDMWKADTDLLLAQLIASRAEEQAAEFPEKRQQWLKLAVELLQRALRASESATTGLDFHYIYYRRSQIYRLLASITRDPDYRREQIKALNQTLSYLPFMSEAAYDLSEALVDQEPYDKEAVLALRRRIYTTDIVYFNTKFVMMVNRLMGAHLYERALQGWQQLLDVDPNHGEWLAGAIHCALRLQNPGLARQLLQRIKDYAPVSYWPTGMSLVDAILNRNWEEVLKQTRNNKFTDAYLRATQRAIEDEARRRLGAEDRPVYNTRPEAVDPAAWERQLAEVRPEMIFALFQDPQQARRAWEERVAMPGPPPGLDFWLTGARIGLALNDRPFTERNLQEAERLQPAAPALRVLREKLAAPPGH